MIPTILHGDWVEQLRTLPENSIDLTVTSPPYDSLRTYGGHKWEFEPGALELFQVTKPGGIVCWNVNSQVVDGSETLTPFKQVIFFVEKCGFRLHDTMIYEKSNGSKPDATRYHQCAEYVFVLSKGKPKTFNPIKDKPNVTAGKSCFGKHTMREKDGSMSVRKDRKVAAEYGTRTNVWKGNTRGQEDCGKALPHPAMMPKWLAHDLILSFSNQGDTVLDPMAGSGTVGMESISLGRKPILIDADAGYVKLIKQFCHVTPGLPL